MATAFSTTVADVCSKRNTLKSQRSRSTVPTTQSNSISKGRQKIYKPESILDNSRFLQHEHSASVGICLQNPHEHHVEGDCLTRLLAAHCGKAYVSTWLIFSHESSISSHEYSG